MFNTAKYLTIAAATAGLLAVTGGQANAGTMVGDWNYAIDSFEDNTGGSDFEMFGIAIKQDKETVTVGINAGMGTDGVTSQWRVDDNNINFGDLMFNFGETRYGVHFAEGNDSFDNESGGLAALGLYSDITTKDVTQANNGHESLKKHNNNSGGHNSFGDLKSSEMSYYESSRSAPVSIASGTKVENDGFTALGASAMAEAGLDFSQVDEGVAGSHTFGFSFNKTEEMVGDFVAHLFYECLNDGMAIEGNLAAVPGNSPETGSVPEPSSLLGLSLFGLSVAGNRLRRREGAANS